MLGVLRGTLKKFPQIGATNQAIIVAFPLLLLPEKHAYTSAKKGFDYQVVESLRAQAAKKGITYK